MDKSIDNLTINTIRALSVDMIQKANSGHPGKPLGSAPMTYELWTNHLRIDPQNKKWINRDRYIMSAGHASALLYSMLHLFNYDVTIEDLKNFRQFNSRTPGHPEFGHTDGIETTTGPLGAGLATAVGMAMAQEHLASKYNRNGYEIFNNYTYAFVGDGCMMEGITSEASSLAGTLNLGRLIVLYDSNNITIEGSTDLAFTENVRKRYEAYGFETFYVEDGNDINAINGAITKAKENLNKPSFIEIKTKIGAGSPLEGSEKTHGAPLGVDNIKKLKENLEYPSYDPFYVDQSVKDHMQDVLTLKNDEYNQWKNMFDEYKKKYNELYIEMKNDFRDIELQDILDDQELWEFSSEPIATRNVSGIIINKLNRKYNNLIGGSADLAGSTMTLMDNETSYSKDNYIGKNLHFGVREHAMAAIGNGIILYGGLKAYIATFMVFSDFLKPMARLSSLMNIPLTYILTHDSIGVGEDGPTHEPIEQLAMLRAQPNFITFRPADATETMSAWSIAMTSKESPVGLILSRQALPQLDGSSKEAIKGGYVISDKKDFEAIIIATGSEVSLAIEAQEELTKENIYVRVVSMPSIELFEKQSKDYRDEILPPNKTSRIIVEAGTSFGWGKFVGLNGEYVTIDTFGASGPGDILFREFGFTVENIINKVKKVL